MKLLKKEGFTFIELLLYIFIFTLVLVGVSNFAWVIIRNTIRSSTQREIGSHSRIISERIKYEIRNAIGINSVSSTSISLSTLNNETNPTVIDLSGGNLRITQGAGPSFALNSLQTKVSNLSFINLSSPDGKTKHIQVLFTLETISESVRYEYRDQATIELSGEVRSN